MKKEQPRTVEEARAEQKSSRKNLRRYFSVEADAERETARLLEEEDKEREARFLQQSRRETNKSEAEKREARSQRSARFAQSRHGTTAKRFESHDRSRSPGGRNTEDPVRPDGTTIRHKWGMMAFLLLVSSLYDAPANSNM